MQGKPITPEVRQDLVNTKTKLAQDLSQEAGRDINPMERVGNMIEKFTDFVTGRPSTPSPSTTPTQSSVSQPVDTGTNDYRTNPSLSYRQENDAKPGASQSTVNERGEITEQSAPRDRPAGWKKGGLVTRR